MSEKEIEKIVIDYLKQITAGFVLANWKIVPQYTIRFGSNRRGQADIALLSNEIPFVIVECKRQHIGKKYVNDGIEQLKSYLNGSKTELGILANDPLPSNWYYFDNTIDFIEIDQQTFLNQIPVKSRTRAEIVQEIQKRKEHLIEIKAAKEIEEQANILIVQAAQRRITEKAIQGEVGLRLQQKVDELDEKLTKARILMVTAIIFFLLSLFIIFVDNM